MGWNPKSPCDYIEKSLTQHPSMFENAAWDKARAAEFNVSQIKESAE